MVLVNFGTGWNFLYEKYIDRGRHLVNNTRKFCSCFVKFCKCFVLEML